MKPMMAGGGAGCAENFKSKGLLEISPRTMVRNGQSKLSEVVDFGNDPMRLRTTF